MKQDTDLHIAYINSRYDRMNKTWMLPTFKVKENVISDVKFVSNPQDFSNQFFNYAKRVTSVAIILMSVFAVLLYIAVENSNTLAMLIMLALMLGVIVLEVILFKSQRKKFRALHESFLNQDIR